MNIQAHTYTHTHFPCCMSIISTSLRHSLDTQTHFCTYNYHSVNIFIYARKLMAWLLLLLLLVLPLSSCSFSSAFLLIQNTGAHYAMEVLFQFYCMCICHGKSKQKNEQVYTHTFFFVCTGKRHLMAIIGCFPLISRNTSNGVLQY